MSPEEKMLHIVALDHDASVVYSQYTRKWFVSASIEIGDGSILRGFTPHCDSPDEAIYEYFEVLKAVDWPKEYLVSRYCGKRREWRWNGAAFQEVTRAEALS